MKLQSASRTDIGQVRQKNEDCVGRLEPNGDDERASKGYIFVVADGMGGHRGGEIASRLAVDTVIATYYASPANEPSTSLRESFRAANEVILQRSQTDVELFGMGTTCTTMVIREGRAYFAHVGDSRAYVLRDEELVRLTEDHSLVGEMVRSGIISDEDAQNHPKRNVITRSLGTQEILRADFTSTPYELQDGDVFLLCSDGLTSMVPEEEVAKVLGGMAPTQACEALVELANLNGGKDNVTVQVVKVSLNH